MPELPEVETVRSGLERIIVGRKIISVENDWAKSFPNHEAEVKRYLIGAHIIAVRRRAKVLMIDLSSNYSLVIHLKMTGQLVYVKEEEKLQSKDQKPSLKDESSFVQALDETREKASPDGLEHRMVQGEERFGAGHPNESLVGELPDKSTRVIFDLDNESKLFFNDQRKFGWVRLMPTIAIEELDFFKKVGPEPLDPGFSSNDFIQCLMRRRNSGIKAVLLDQTIVAGVGNIYADESLWGAKIHPSTLVRNISDAKLKKLYVELRYVLTLAIEKGGSTDKNYVNAEGRRGSYMDFARVFRREKLPCPRCGSVIQKTKVAGRGTHTCPKCQKLN